MESNKTFRRLLVEKAQANNRIVLTFDLDFGAILALGVLASPSIVIFRLTDRLTHNLTHA